MSQTTQSSVELRKVVRKYNLITGKNISHFPSLDEGIKRLNRASQEYKMMLENQTPEEGLQEIETPEQQEAREARNEKISKGVTETWQDDAIRTSRRQRHVVEVAGYGLYPSTFKAFTALDLPINKHIGFRKQLKVEKILAFKHEEKEYTFQIIEKSLNEKGEVIDHTPLLFDGYTPEQLGAKTSKPKPVKEPKVKKERVSKKSKDEQIISQ